jgi:hypothetical protein
MIRLRKKFNQLQHRPEWRKLQVVYLVTALLISVGLIAGAWIYNSQEKCVTTSSTRTEHSYYKSGPQNWNNSAYSYEVPVTSTKCSTNDERGDGINAVLVAILPIVVFGIGYLFLPVLFHYLNPPKSNKSG